MDLYRNHFINNFYKPLNINYDKKFLFETYLQSPDHPGQMKIIFKIWLSTV